VRLVEVEPQDALEALRDRRADIAVIFDDPEHPFEQDGGLRLRYVFDDQMLLALPVGHHAARRQRVPLGELRDALWIQGAGPDSGSSLILAAACRAAGFVPNTTFRSGNYRVVRELVSAGVGVALMPRLAIDAAREDVVFRELAPASPYRRIALATRQRPGLSAGAAALLDGLDAACERWRGRFAAPLAA
jgi:DNA-binding transcriptional LysR family regulator